MSSSAPRDVTKLLSGSLLAKIFGMLSLMLFTRTLPKTEMAVFPAFMMLAGLSNLVLTFGIFSAFTIQLPDLIRTDMRRARSLVVTASAVILAGTIVFSIAAYVWSGAMAQFAFRDADQGWVIRIMIPGFLAYMVSRIVEYVMWGRGQFGATSFLQALEAFVRPVCTMVLFFPFGYLGVVVGLVGAQVILALVGFYLIRDLYSGRLLPDYPLGKLISESMSYYAGNYLSFFRGDGDTVLVAALLGPAALSDYFVAKTLYGNVGLAYTAVDKVATERLARPANSSGLIERAVQIHDRIAVFAVPFCMLIAALTPNLMLVLAGGRYANVQWAAVILVLVMLVQFVSIPFDRVVYVKLPGWIRLKYTTIEAIVATGAVALLAPLAGVVGVAWARVFAPLGVCIFGMLLLHRYLAFRLPLKNTLLSIWTCVPATAAVLLFVPRGHTAVGAVLNSVLALVVWAALFISYGCITNRSLLVVLAETLMRQLRKLSLSWKRTGPHSVV